MSHPYSRIGRVGSVGEGLILRLEGGRGVLVDYVGGEGGGDWTICHALGTLMYALFVWGWVWWGWWCK